MSDLTREQIEALATGHAMHAGSADVTWLPPGAQGWQDEVCFIGHSADIIRARAREVLAARERRCGTCRHWVDEDGYDVCQRLRLVNLPHSFGCTDWTAKEER